MNLGPFRGAGFRVPARRRECARPSSPPRSRSGVGYVPTFGLHAKSMVVDHQTGGHWDLQPRPAGAPTSTPSAWPSCRHPDMAASGGRPSCSRSCVPANAWPATFDRNPRPPCRVVQALPNVAEGGGSRLSAVDDGLAPGIFGAGGIGGNQHFAAVVSGHEQEDSAPRLG